LNLLIYDKLIYVCDKRKNYDNLPADNISEIKSKIFDFLRCEELLFLIEKSNVEITVYVLKIYKIFYQIYVHLNKGVIKFINQKYSSPPANSYIRLLNWRSFLLLKNDQWDITVSTILCKDNFKETIKNICFNPEIFMKFLFDESSEIHFKYSKELYEYLFTNIFKNFFNTYKFFLENVSCIAVGKNSFLEELSSNNINIFSKSFKIYFLSDKAFYTTEKESVDKGLFFESKISLENDYYHYRNPEISIIPGNKIECVIFILKTKFPLLKKKPILLKLKTLLEFKFELHKYKKVDLLGIIR
jgi:hypothetical protein